MRVCPWRLCDWYAIRVQVFAASWVEDEVQKSFTLTPFRSPAIANVRGACPLCWWSHRQTIALFQPAVWGLAHYDSSFTLLCASDILKTL